MRKPLDLSAREIGMCWAATTATVWLEDARGEHYAVILVKEQALFPCHWNWFHLAALLYGSCIRHAEAFPEIVDLLLWQGSIIRVAPLALLVISRRFVIKLYHARFVTTESFRSVKLAASIHTRLFIFSCLGTSHTC